MPEKNTYQPYAIVLRLSFPKVSSLYATLIPCLYAATPFRPISVGHPKV